MWEQNNGSAGVAVIMPSYFSSHFEGMRGRHTKTELSRAGMY